MTPPTDQPGPPEVPADDLPPASRPPSKPRRWLGGLLKVIGVLFVLALIAVVLWFAGALYHHWVRFPREAAAWKELRAQRQPVPATPGWQEYRGILHSHSHLSHDSEVPFEEILRVMQSIRLDFICLSDHANDGRADFDRQWRGAHAGKLFIPGFEMTRGFMPFGVASGVVLSNQTDAAVLAAQIVTNGGVLFYAHPEEPREWDLPELTGMEIYNIHTDFKRQRHPLLNLLPELLVNQREYPDQVFRLIFHRPTEFLQHWDALNRTRHLTGIAGNDCHQNTGLRIFSTPKDSLRFEDTSPKTITELKLNWLTRPLARRLFGSLEPNRLLFHFQLDPYERMARYVNTHVLAHGLGEAAILDSLRAGRVFVGFDMVADSAGFRWYAARGEESALPGERLRFGPEVRLHALSPLPCRFTVLKDGVQVYQQAGRALEWTPTVAGKYRVEAEIKVLNEWIPWVYANPIELHGE